MQQDLSEKGVQKLKQSPPNTGYLLIYDTGKGAPRGFGLRVTTGGVASFFIEYRLRGRKRRFTIGQHPEWSLVAARDEATDLRAQINKGQDPAEKRASEHREPTMEDLGRDYLERHARPHKRPSSVRNDVQMLDRVILPRLGNLRITAVSRRDVESLHLSLKGVPYRANRVLSLLSKMFSLAMEWKWRFDNPAKNIKRFDEVEREAWLTEEQLEALARALDEYPFQDAADALRLAILTGSRSHEVMSAEWSQFDLRHGIWTKKSHATKQKKDEHSVLNEPALAILRRMEKEKRSAYLFPGRKDHIGKEQKIDVLERARVTLRRPWIQVSKAAGLATEYTIPGKRGLLTRYKPMFRIHDLRHSFASHLVSRGQSLHVVGSLLGHTRPETMKRYAHLSDSARREAAKVFPWPSRRAAKKRTRSATA